MTEAIVKTDPSKRRADPAPAAEPVRRGVQLPPPFPGEEDARSAAAWEIVLSVRPPYVEAILAGRKTVELRRRFPRLPPGGARALLYASAPVKALAGVVWIREVQKKGVGEIWAEFGAEACIAHGSFVQYFAGLEEGCVLILEEACALPHPLPLGELRSRFGFTPPQSFLYASADLQRAVQEALQPSGSPGGAGAR